MKAIEHVDVYFDDLDLMGIMHNARYAVLIERAITAYWIRRGFPFDSSRGLLAVAEFTITYRVPVTRLGPLGVEFWVDRLGRSSCVYGYRVVSPDETVHAYGTRVMINLDPLTRRPAPWPDETREVAEGLLLPVEEPAHQG
ncbi:acyl-CoA thioesterase [Virgisporangium aurantiacum]|uniref:Thioesterase n=1 Tax=Virgisporangium aurantiacum TaxID=175570 RepID=A0A8J4E2I9_9ACTN|nr:thioesterase family protein [Virgisporangium aurantiacum]GIJ59890.1 thioesterase [Virgisporangium aurantiacum]